MRIYNLITLTTRNAFMLILTFVLLLIISDRIITGVLSLIGNLDMGSPFYFDIGLLEQFFLAVIFTPIVETIIFHFMLLELLLFLFKNAKYKEYWVVLISAIPFSLSHFYSTHYIIYSFFAGIILSTAYLVARKKEMLPFAVVFIIHACYNLISFTYNNYLR
jgi:uncharacterized protein